MNHQRPSNVTRVGALRLLISVIAFAAMLPLAGIANVTPAAAQGATATITVKSFGPDGSTPLPFARFTVTDSNGTVYRPLESTPPNGTVSFSVDPGDGTLTFTVEESVPPSCGAAPDPVTVDSLAAGDTKTVEMTTTFDKSCDKGSVSAYRYVCPSGFDTSSDYATFSSTCTDTVDDIPFTLSTNGRDILTVQTGAYGISGRAPIVDLAAGTYQLREDDTPDGALYAFCMNFPGNAATGSATYDKVTQAKLGDNGATIKLKDNRVACDFFAVPGAENGAGNNQSGNSQGNQNQNQNNDNQATPDAESESGGSGQITEGNGSNTTNNDSGNGNSNSNGNSNGGDNIQAADAGSGYIELHAIACPPGYSAGNYFNDCHANGLKDITFTVKGPNSYSNSGKTTVPKTPGPGIAAFDNLDAGTYTITESIPGDTADTYIYCSMADSDQQVSFDQADQGGISLKLTDGMAVVCDWYTIPEQQQQQPQNTRLQITKYTCPAGYDTSGKHLSDYQSDCQHPTSGVTFTLTSDANSSLNRQKATSNSGNVVFGDLTPATYTVSEDVPGDFSTPVVYCQIGNGAPYAKTITNGATTFGIDGSDPNVSCSWYNVPENAKGGTGYIELHSLACPAGYDGSNYFNDCHPNGLKNITFNISGPNGYSNSAKTTVPKTPGPGIAAFDNLDPGTYTITQDIPGDFNNVYIYCSMANSDQKVSFNTTNQGSISLKLTDGMAVVCDWYNTPEQQFQFGTLTITKFTCPAGYDGENAARGDFENDCDNATAGVTFYVTEQGAVEPHESGKTDANGQISFDKFNPNTYQISESVSGKSSMPYAFCSSDSVNGGTPFQLDTSDGTGYIKFDGSGQAFSCEWFNVPVPQKADAKITLHKKLCPDGYGGSNYINDCTQPVSNVTFNATGAGDYQVNATTGPEGIAWFQGLVRGTYTVTELPPSGIDVAVYVVGCSDANGPVNFSYDDSTGLRINLKVATSQQIDCNWYNIPPKKGPSGSITVHKFLCQGNKDNQYNWEQDCSNYGDGADFDLQDSTGKKLSSGTTNGDGQILFSGLADGAYGLDETSGNWCHAEADQVDAKGNVLVKNGANTDVFIYNCTAKKPVTGLPTTGVGPIASSPAGTALWSVAGGLSGLLVLVFLALRTRTRPALVPVRRRITER
ncbi:MAG TPA: SpaA isopeptide-forming pilin-related protein [Thermomicrobiales bacterium]|nr:SpaA isopeptide-forming pilin-related protein [Thermomicrobiales bacterium]